MALIGPEVGSYALKFEGTDVDSVAVVAATPYYPDNGRGGFTTDPDESIVRNTDRSVLTYLHGTKESVTSILTFYDGDDNAIFYFQQADTAVDQWGIDFGDNGPVLYGNWYVVSSTTTPEWNIGFKILS